MMPTDAELLERIEAFLTLHEMPPTRFGLDAMGDGALLQTLREGRSLSIKNAHRVLAYMEQASAQSSQAV